VSLAHLRANIAAMAQLAAAGPMHARFALVSTAHDREYAVKLLLQPEGIETGYVPVLTPFVGNGWGLFCKPVQGDQVLVLFADGDTNCGVVVGGLFSDEDVALAAPEREFWLVHGDGASLKFQAGGVVNLVAPGGLNIAANTAITGTLHVTDEVTADKSVTATTDVVGGGKHLKTHTHGGVQPGGGHSAAPD
jgi:phage baseplate assembly protein V